ncbi:hypothetical protein [Consotaella aegiceratis]|uniref:hypothetical protein n=1 Tax=Consotaella aegiceratis TaxID=3097961 RepID=UPI002F3E7867
MRTPRETILAALYARLSALPATALRGEVLPERVPAEGLLILRDGEPGEPEVTLSPLAYHYQHRAEIEAVVQGYDRNAPIPVVEADLTSPKKPTFRQILASGNAPSVNLASYGRRCDDWAKLGICEQLRNCASIALSVAQASEVEAFGLAFRRLAFLKLPCNDCN